MPDLRDELLPIIAQAAKTYGVPESLLIQMMSWESGNFNSDVVYGRRRGADGEIGVAQFMPGTAETVSRQIGKFNPADPYEAIPAAAWLLKSEYDHFGDWEQSVAAYNAGRGAVDFAVNKAKTQKKGSTLGDITFGAVGDRSGFGGGDWKQYIPESTRTQYLPNTYGAGPDAPSPGTFSTAYKPASSTSGGTRQMGPPDLGKFIDEYGEVDGYAQYLESYKAYQQIRYQEAADISTYLDIVTNEISQEIALGNLSLAQANADYGRRMDALTQGSSMYKDMLQYAIPPSSVNGYLPGGEPGGIYSQMGMNPRIIPGSDVSTINPFAMANDILSQSMPIPNTIPDASRLAGGAEAVKAALERARAGGATQQPAAPSPTSTAGLSSTSYRPWWR